MRVGTWNLEGRWSAAHSSLLTAQDCDVWLLTEVPGEIEAPDLDAHFTATRMGERKYWAAILSRGLLLPLPDPHPASAAAKGMGLVWCSSILPWRSCVNEPWGAGDFEEKTTRTVGQIMVALPPGDLVWGGDWNHALGGREYVGSLAGRAAIELAVADRHLTVATRDAPHRIPGLCAIDHVAVPDSARVLAVSRVIAEDRHGKRLSDHDAYTTDIILV